MTDSYFHEFINSNAVKRLLERGLIIVENEGLEIKFVKSTKSSVVMDNLYIGTGQEEGALVVRQDAVKFAFYLPDFGINEKIDSTASELADIVEGLLDVCGAYVAFIGDCKAILVKTGSRTIWSTTAYSKNILDNIKWTLRPLFKTQIERI